MNHFTFSKKDQKQKKEPSHLDKFISLLEEPNPKAWVEFFFKMHPNCNINKEIMLGWFINAMMTVNDYHVNHKNDDFDWDMKLHWAEFVKEYKDQKQKKEQLPLDKFISLLEENKFVLLSKEAHDESILVFSNSEIRITVRLNDKPLIKVSPGIPITHSELFYKIKRFGDSCDFDFRVVVNYLEFITIG